jgi:dinuclear metal center YbgI/SA1388 family protein
MAKLQKIVKFLDDYLKIDDIKDDSWNGLQIEGKAEVKKIIFAEDASIDSFKKAVKEKADLIVVHHGHFWKTGNPSVVGWNKKRIDLLYKNDISLYACHLPLDRHKEVGNNAQLLKLLGAKIKSEFMQHEGKNICWIGLLKKPVPVKEIEKKLNSELNTKCVVLPFGKEKVRTIAVCSGGGDYRTFFEALNKKVDLYITGDISNVYVTAKDAGFNVIFAGHYATETVGLRALSKIVKRKFKVETVFVDIPTEL